MSFPAWAKMPVREVATASRSHARYRGGSAARLSSRRGACTARGWLPDLVLSAADYPLRVRRQSRIWAACSR